MHSTLGASTCSNSAWALFEGVVVFGGYSELPVVNLGLGFIRALAVVAVSFAAVDLGLGAAFRGERSIVVYLAFFLPMATMRALLLKFAPGLDLGVVALIVTMVAAITPLLFYAVVKYTRLSFLFERTAWARLKPARPPTLASDRLSGRQCAGDCRPALTLSKR